jgi:hypothetical protein
MIHIEQTKRAQIGCIDITVDYGVLSHDYGIKAHHITIKQNAILPHNIDINMFDNLSYDIFGNLQRAAYDINQRYRHLPIRLLKDPKYIKQLFVYSLRSVYKFKFKIRQIAYNKNDQSIFLSVLI